jgi:hypothetical protein
MGAAIVCALCLWAWPAPSLAGGTDEAGARVLFTEGRKLAASGDYPRACLKFEDSLRLDPGIGTSYNLADCLEHMGRTASAWGRFLDVAAATRAAGQPERERVARTRAAALEPKLARLVVEVSAPGPGLVVERDGVGVGPASWGMAIPVDPGHHIVEASAPGMKKWSQSAEVADAPTTLVVSVPPLELLATEAAPVVASQTLERAPGSGGHIGHPPSRWSLPVISLGTLSVVAIATGVALAFRVQSENADAMALCPGSTCQSTDEKARHDSLVSDAYRDRDLAFAGAGVGAAALLAAAYLWWRAGWSPSAKTSTGALRPFSARPLAGELGGHLELAW